MRSRTTTLLASEGLASHYNFELAVCLQVNVWPTHTRDWLAPYSQTTKPGRYLDGA